MRESKFESRRANQWGRMQNKLKVIIFLKDVRRDFTVLVCQIWLIRFLDCFKFCIYCVCLARLFFGVYWDRHRFYFVIIKPVGKVWTNMITASWLQPGFRSTSTNMRDDIDSSTWRRSTHLMFCMTCTKYGTTQTLSCQQEATRTVWQERLNYKVHVWWYFTQINCLFCFPPLFCSPIKTSAVRSAY